MIPTWLTGIALGLGNTAISLLITAMSAWVNGSFIVSGNIFHDTTNTRNPGIFVDTKEVQRVSTGSALNFITNGIQTGGVIRVDGLTREQTYGVTCTGTGGITTTNTWYDTCITKSPFITTGSLLGVSLECGSIKIAAFTASGSFVKGLKADASLARYPVVLKSSRVTTGALIRTTSGAGIPWNPLDYLKIGTPSAISGTTGFDCKMFYTAADKSGS